jgi:hypothetical protein
VRSTPYTKRRGARVSWLSLKTNVDGLSVVWCQNHWDGLSVVWSQNHWDGFSIVLPQNHWDSFLWFDLKTGDDGFFDFALKSMVGFLVEPQNQGGGGFPGFILKTNSYGLVIWASKSL